MMSCKFICNYIKNYDIFLLKVPFFFVYDYEKESQCTVNENNDIRKHNKLTFYYKVCEL